MSDRDAGLPVDLATRFDQFPATVKGAFVMRGADGNPHAVEMTSCSLDRTPAGPSNPIPLGAVQVHVAPGRDLYVPFEAGVADLDPGWYAIRSVIRVDAGPSLSFSSRGFSVQWPRELVRRGTLRAGRKVRVGKLEAELDTVEMRADCAVVAWSISPGKGGPGEAAPVGVELFADGRELERIPPGARPLGPRAEARGGPRAVFYPVPREAEALRVVFRAGPASSDPMELPLP